MEQSYIQIVAPRTNKANLSDNKVNGSAAEFSIGSQAVVSVNSCETTLLLPYTIVST